MGISGHRCTCTSAVSAQEPVAASAEVAVADPTDEGHLLPQHWGSAATALLPAVCYVVKIHLPKLQESLHRLAGMDAISHILQMWEAKHYRKLHDLWHTQYESISVGNFALAFTTTLLAPTLAREFNTDDSYGLFTDLGARRWRQPSNVRPPQPMPCWSRSGK